MSPPVQRNRRRAYRADIEGLRAVAVLAVVLYHAHVGLFRGGYVGVDVFFVISGFLITDLLWEELQRTGRLSLPMFYARRMRRLLPAAVLVLVVTMAAAARWMPPLQTRSVWRDGAATALYVANYRFALTQTNYLTASAPPSPFQHYWSLGVEEQFYIVWPLLILLAGRLRRHRPATGLAVAALGTVASVSFLFSLLLTRTDEPWAFFSLPTRAWELAAGGLLALAVPWLKRMPGTIAAGLGWFGLAAIISSVVVFTASTAFPGVAAVLPVAGAGAVLAAGVPSPAFGPVLVLRRRALQFFGRISYSLYLWHWPVLTLTPYIVGHGLNEAEYLGLVLVSTALAVATFLLVERPVRDWSWMTAPAPRSLTLGASLSVCGVAACLVAAAALPSTAGRGVAPVAALRSPAGRPRPVTGSAAAQPTPLHPANPLVAQFAAAQSEVAAAVTRSLAATDVPANLDPPLAQAAASQPAPAVDGCMLAYEATTSPTCLFGDTTASTSIVLFGDSHATMWFPAVDAYANTQHLRLYVWTKATCPPVALSIFSPVLGREFSECDIWRNSIMARIQALKPSLVLLGTAPNYNPAYHIVQDGPQWFTGLTTIIDTLRPTGARVAVLGPIPSPDDVVPDCLSAHLTSSQACAVPAEDPNSGGGTVGYNATGLSAEQTVVEQAGSAFINVKPWFCNSTSCPPIVDNLLVYRDNSHITVPYALYLSPLVADALQLPAAA